MRHWFPAATLLAGAALLVLGATSRTVEPVLGGLAFVALADGYLLVHSDLPTRALAALLVAPLGVVPVLVAPDVGYVLAGTVAVVAGAVVLSGVLDRPAAS